MANDETMNDLLDETLDDLADLPQSKPFPAGAHKALMFITRNPTKKTTYVVKFKHQETLEVTAPTAEMPKPGDESTMFIHTKTKDNKPNEFGQGQLKMILKPLAERLGTTNISELLEATKPGIEVGIVSGVKSQEGYNDQMTLAKIQLV